MRTKSIKECMAKLQHIEANFAKLQKIMDMTVSKDDLEQMVQFIMEDLDELVNYCYEEIVKARCFVMFIAFFFLFLCSKENQKGLLRPESRGLLTCSNVYLLGNEGTHAYNGNGKILTKPQTKSIKYRPLNEDENHNCHVLTVQEIAVIATKIGLKYRVLGLRLGISQAEIEQMQLDNSSAVSVNAAILIRWMDVKGNNATVANLVDACKKVKINYNIVYESLDYR